MIRITGEVTAIQNRNWECAMFQLFGSMLVLKDPAIMVPMIVGPFIGAWVISGAGQTYVDLGVVKPVPGPEMFIAAAVVLVFVPVMALVRARVERGAR